MRERLEGLLSSARLNLHNTNSLRGCAKITAYNGISIEYFDHFTIGYLPEVFVPYCSGKILDSFGEGGYRYMFIAIVVIIVIGIIMLTVWDRYVKNLKATQKNADEVEA